MRKYGSTCILVGAALSTICIAPFVLAGRDEPRLSGKVLDAAKNPVVGAAVTLRNTADSTAITTISGITGTYAFDTLVTGIDYEIRAAGTQGLASPIRTLRFSSDDEKAGINLPLSTAIEFEEIAAQSSLKFTTRNGASGHAYQPEIMIGGVAAFDFDQDGCTDVFFTNGAPLPRAVKDGPEYRNRLFRNQCNGTFTDVTQGSGLQGTGYDMGVAAGDFDNDGLVDLLVTGIKRITLYKNLGHGKFEDVTAKAGMDQTDPKYGPRWSVSAGWLDYDNDGRLDLFVTNYVHWSPELDKCSAAGHSFYCHPRVYPGLPNQLFHNNGDGTFTDVSERSGIGASVGKGMGLAFGDFNGDGLTDVFVANDSVPNFLFENLGRGKFREVAVRAGVAYLSHGKAVAGMGADFRDLDNDGLEDIASDAMYFDTFPLFRNGGTPHFFVDHTAPSGVALGTRDLTGWGMGIYDFDNDGYKDLFFATSHFPGSEPYVHSPAEIANHVFRNNGNGYFEDVSKLAGPGFQKAGLNHGAAFADFDNDGKLDAVVTTLNGPARLFHNTSSIPAHWAAPAPGGNEK